MMLLLLRYPYVGKRPTTVHARRIGVKLCTTIHLNTCVCVCVSPGIPQTRTPTQAAGTQRRKTETEQSVPLFYAAKSTILCLCCSMFVFVNLLTCIIESCLLVKGHLPCSLNTARHVASPITCP